MGWGKFLGHVDFGTGIKGDEGLRKAGEVLVFMEVGINYSFQFPCAFFAVFP